MKLVKFEYEFSWFFSLLFFLIKMKSQAIETGFQKIQMENTEFLDA